jgi:hypothetical protein
VEQELLVRLLVQRLVQLLELFLQQEELEDD